MNNTSSSLGITPSILIVEDSASQRLVVRSMLESAGYQVIEAEDGLQAITVLKERLPDLVIMDVFLPEMDGFATCTKIKALPEGKNIPILMVTEFNDEKIVEQAFEAGADDFISKPIQWPVMRVRLRNMFKARKAERNFTALAQSATDAIITMNGQGVVLYFNPAAESLFGYLAVEIEGQELSLLMPKGFRKQHRAGIKRFLKTRQPKVIGHTVELVGLHKNGQEFPMELSLSVTESAGEVNFTGIIRDISERIQAKADLEHSHQFMQSVLASLPHPFYVINVADYSIEIANPAAGRIAESEQTTCHVLTHKSDQHCGTSEHSCPLEEVKRTKKPAIAVHIHSDEIGADRYVEVRAFPIFDGQGNIKQVIEYSLDITEKERLEQEVRSEKAYLESILTSAPDAIVTLDSQHHVKRWNPGAHKLFGYSEVEVIGKNLDDLITGSDSELINEANRLTQLVLAGGAVPATEGVRYRKDGQPVHVIMAGSPIFGGDELGGAVAIYTDISQRVQIEKTIRKSQERYEQIFQSVGAAIWVEDFLPLKAAIDELKMNGIEDFTTYLDEHPEFITQAAQLIQVRDVNQAVLAMLGANSKDELLGALDKVIVQETMEILRSEIIAIAEGSRHFEGETINRSLNGDLINVLTTINFPENTDEFDNVLVSMMDITERVGLEKELSDINQELETLNSTLEERVRQRTYELQVLHELSQEISYTLEYEELFRRMLSHLHRIVDYDVAVCLLVLDDSPILYRRTARPLDVTLQEEIQTRLANTFGRMQEINKMDWSNITIHELEQLDAHQIEQTTNETSGVKALSSTFQVPLIERTSKKMIGLMYIGAEKQGAFSEEIVRTLYTLSNQASILLERLRALMDVEQQRLESLVDRIPEGVILLDKERKAILVNPTGQVLLAQLSDIRQGQVLSVLGGQEIDLLLQPKADGLPHEITINSGEHQVLEVEGRQIESGPEAGGWALVIRDVTWERDLLNEEQTRRKELDALYSLSRELTSTDDFDDVLQTISQHAVESINISFSRVILHEKEQGFQCHAAYPIRLIGHDLGKGKFEPEDIWPYYQEVLLSKEPVLFNVSDAAYPSEFRDCSFYKDVQILCMTPLRIGDEALGILVLGESRSSHREPFGENKVRMTSAIGDQAASAIHRATLNNKTIQSLRRMTALRQIDMAIASSVDLNINLSVVLNQITSQLDVDAANIMILNENQQKLEYASSSGFRTKGINKLSVSLGEGYAGQVTLQQETVFVPDLKKEPPVGVYAKAIAGEDFYSYYGVPFLVKGKIKGVLEIYHRSPLHYDNDWLDYLKTLAGQTAIAIDSAEMFNDLQRSNIEMRMAYDATIEGWARALEYRDMETEGHSRRVVDLTVLIAAEMGVPQEEIIHIRRGALLHDIGKMGIPDSVLNKKGPLNNEEWELMHQHPAFAKELLGQVTFLQSSLDIPYCHHERWDGTGYPQGLKASQIPLSARIFAVVDVWDALRSDRPYRDAWSVEKTIAHIQEQSGKHFDPRVVELFIANQEGKLVEMLTTILIVDDDEELVQNLAGELGDQYRVLTANSGEAALALVERTEIAVVLTDYYMPQMTGIQLLTQVHKIKPSTVGILISGFIDQDILSQAINLGNVRGFISKPVKIDEIRQRLEDALKIK